MWLTTTPPPFTVPDHHVCRTLFLIPKNQVEAHKYDLNYIGLSGNIGCMVNGAGCVFFYLSIYLYTRDRTNPAHPSTYPPINPLPLCV